MHRQRWHMLVSENLLTRWKEEFVITRWSFPCGRIESFSCEFHNTGQVVCIVLSFWSKERLSSEKKEGRAAQHPYIRFLIERSFQVEDDLRRTERRWVPGVPFRIFVGSPGYSEVSMMRPRERDSGTHRVLSC